MIIDGKKIASKIISDLDKSDKFLNLVIFFPEKDQVAGSYVSKKHFLAKQLGVKCRTEIISVNTTTAQLVKRLQDVQKSKQVDGIMVQLPLPKGINTQRIINRIKPSLDVDCLTTYKQAQLSFKKDPILLPPVVAGIWEILDEYKIDLSCKSIVVVGYGRLVGRPLVHTLLKKGLTVTICQEDCNNLSTFTRQADVLISATGKPGLITGDMVKEGAVVIDAGTTEARGVVKGDVVFKEVKSKASLITPITGGLGPITVACLFRNLFNLRIKKKE